MDNLQRRRKKSSKEPVNLGDADPITESKTEKGSYHIIELVVYGVHLLFFFGFLMPTIGSEVRQKCLGWPRCRQHLREVWLGYHVDLADGQWSDLRKMFPLLWMTLLGTAGGHWLCRRIWHKSLQSVISDCATITAWFRLLVGLVFLYVLHGYHALIVLAIAFVGYRITRWQAEYNAGGREGGAWITWLFAAAVLLLKESYRVQHKQGFHFLRPLFSSQYGGMYRWQLPANFLILRIVAYSFDFRWAVDAAKWKGSAKTNLASAQITAPENATAGDTRSASIGPRKRGESDPQDTDASQEEVEKEKKRSFLDEDGNAYEGNAAPLTHENLNDQPRPLDEYNLVTFLSYIVYCPLYTAGPIMSFNAFAENTHRPQRTEDPLPYALRWILCFALMELLTSRFPFFAVMKSDLFLHLTPAELALVCYVTLKMMWLKFLLTWRFFRLWALADGTLAPENMLRCMSNNCSLEQFWRGWHASFNKWIVRYMYKPMGGRSTRLYSVWIIFLFVAVWHDIEWKLVAWGLLNGVFYVIEVLAKRFANTSLMQSLPSGVFRFITVLSGATYILVLIAVNLVGYAVGVGGVRQALNKLLTWDGIWVMLASYYFIAVACSFMGFLQRVGWTAAAAVTRPVLSFSQ
jgi:D-alanyl-lipoteichoic acid acyltransferase DltB (MBOAT superfamily)